MPRFIDSKEPVNLPIMKCVDSGFELVPLREDLL